MKVVAEYKAPQNAFKPTCRKCEHNSPGWCKRYASVIRNSEPVTRCARRAIGGAVDMHGQQATRAAMAGSDLAAYAGDPYRGR
jgi:hypothetical protein